MNGVVEVLSKTMGSRIHEFTSKPSPETFGCQVRGGGRRVREAKAASEGHEVVVSEDEGEEGGQSGG